MILAFAGASSGAWTHITDPHAVYRDEFSGLLLRVGLERDRAIALAETTTGRPFDTCAPMDLVPVLELLLEVVHSCSRRVEAEQWHV